MILVDLFKGGRRRIFYMLHSTMNLKIYSILTAIFFLAIENDSANSASNISLMSRKANNSYVRLPQTQAQAYQTQHVQKKWLTDLFLEARSAFHMQGDVNADCRRDFSVYQQFLENQTVWAIRMSEATQWPSFGLFSGITHHMGNWDECMKATPTDFNSQYCLVSAKFNFTYNPSIDEGSFEWTSWPNEKRSAWDVIQLWSKDDNRISRQIISWAMCIPASCRESDLEVAVNKTLHPIFKKYDLTLSVHVQPDYCKTNEEIPYPISFYAMCIFILLYVIHVIMITTYESNIPDDLPLKGFKKNTVIYARFFSLRQNLKMLRKFSPENTFPIVHLVKVITAFGVIAGHRFMVFYMFPTFNTEYHEMERQEFTFELVESGIVDIFITISGFLMFHYSYENVQKGGSIFIFFYIIMRWLRMICVPTYTIIFMLLIGQYLYTGPIWNHYIELHAGLCKRNWWTTILAVNNIIEPDKACLPQTWYLSLDLQLTIMGALILFIMSKNMKRGVILCILLIAASFIVTAVVISMERYWAIWKYTINNSRDFLNVREYYMFYVAPYNRIGSYIVGMLAALLSRRLKENKYRFSPIAASLILASSFIISISFTSYGFLFYKAHRTYNVIENAVYGAIYRILFSFPIACLFCIHFTSGLGVFNNILNNKIFVPYGRLVYCVYILGPPLQMLQVMSLKTYIPFQEKIFGYWMATGDFIWVYCFAFVVHMMVEAPCNNILKFGQDKLLRKVH